MSITIGIFASFALIFAVLVVVLRQPMRAALALIAHMISLAAIFACLNVHVVALFQVLIYVGAVMVLMIYTIMLLDDSDPSYVKVFSRWSVPAIVVAAIVMVALGVLLGTAAPDAPAAAQPGDRDRSASPNFPSRSCRATGSTSRSPRRCSPSASWPHGRSFLSESANDERL